MNLVKASITHLQTRLTALEKAPGQPGTLDDAKHILQRISQLDTKFRDIHLALADQLDNPEEEKAALDEHDDVLAALTIRLQSLGKLINKEHHPNPDENQVVRRRLRQIEDSLARIEAAVEGLSGDPENSCRLQQYDEQLADHRKSLADINLQLLSLGVDPSHELSTQHSSLETKLFDCSVSIKQALADSILPAPAAVAAPSSSVPTPGVKLLKLEVPF